MKEHDEWPSGRKTSLAPPGSFYKLTMVDDIPAMTGTVAEYTYPMNSCRDLPLDSSYGKYPLIIVGRGTGSYKYAHHVN